MINNRQFAQVLEFCDYKKEGQLAAPVALLSAIEKANKIHAPSVVYGKDLKWVIFTWQLINGGKKHQLVETLTEYGIAKNPKITEREAEKLAKDTKKQLETVES